MSGNKQLPQREGRRKRPGKEQEASPPDDWTDRPLDCGQEEGDQGSSSTQRHTNSQKRESPSCLPYCTTLTIQMFFVFRLHFIRNVTASEVPPSNIQLTDWHVCECKRCIEHTQIMPFSHDKELKTTCFLRL